MGGFADYETYDGLGLAELVRRRETSPEELLDCAVERAESRNPALGAIVTPLYDAARSAIAEGLPDGPYRGVPFLLKDLHALARGTVTTHGSALFKDFVADRDTELVARYRRAGLVIFGKTNTPELGLSPSTEPRLFGPSRNPWNPEHSPGGSSGGAAAAVAARILPVAHASDGGGSIRIPASCCGLFGLKPTRGRTPMGPLVGEGWAGMSAQHVVSVTVRDSAALLDATAGPAAGDPYAAPAPARPYLAEVGRDPERLRIALSVAAHNGTPVDPECAEAARAAAALCEELGHEVVEADPPVDAELLQRSSGAIIGTQTQLMLETRAAELGRELAQEDVENVTWTLVQLGRATTGKDYAAAVRGIHALGRAVGAFFDDVDVLLTPMMARPPARLGVLHLDTTDVEAYLDALRAATGFSQLLNASGQPAASLPLAWSRDGLPLGVQLAGRFGDEATLFRLSSQLERARPWRDRRPALAG